MKRTFIHRTTINAPADVAFRWHEMPGAFGRLAPPWEQMRIVQRTNGITNGERLIFQVKMGPIWQSWVAEHYGYQSGVQFADRQLSGPFAKWEHVHRIIPDGPDRCTLEDHVDYELPMAPFSNVAPRCLVERKLDAMFAYRSAVTKRDIESHYKAALAPKRVLISGASGLVGGELIPFLQGGGHKPVRLVRKSSAKGADEIAWDADKGFSPESIAAMEGLDAVVHLAGESILGFWSEDKKRRIRDSRVKGTRLLCEALAKLKTPPAVLVCASAIGIYGERGEENVTEDSALGSGFLADVGREWEAATKPASDAGIRVVHLRTGIVLSPKGGALKQMLLPFSLGLGGRLGDGNQWMSWISIDDLIGAIHHAIVTESLSGPLNAVAPNPVTNKDLTATLARVLHRPVGPPAPAFILRTIMKEMAREIFLVSTRVKPLRLIDSGYQFAHEKLEDALRHLLGRTMVNAK